MIIKSCKFTPISIYYTIKCDCGETFNINSATWKENRIICPKCKAKQSKNFIEKNSEKYKIIGDKNLKPIFA